MTLYERQNIYSAHAKLAEKIWGVICKNKKTCFLRHFWCKICIFR